MVQPGHSAGMFRRFSSALCTIVLAAQPNAALAELRAVLVGVSDYLTLDADLKGSANDVRLMAQALAATTISITQGNTAQMPDGEGPMLNQTLFGTAAPRVFRSKTASCRLVCCKGSIPAITSRFMRRPKVARHWPKSR